MQACDFQSLVTAASPLQQIPPAAAELVKIYLLQKIAGGSAATMTPQQLVSAVDSYQMIRSDILAKRIQAYLLCQIVNEV